MQCSPPAFADVTFAQALCARCRGETLAKVASRAICNKADGWAPRSLYIDQVSVTARYCEVECWRVGLRPNVSVFQCLLKRLLWVWLQ